MLFFVTKYFFGKLLILCVTLVWNFPNLCWSASVMRASSAWRLFYFTFARCQHLMLCTLHGLVQSEIMRIGRSIKRHDWENQTVLSCRKDIFWKICHPGVYFFNFRSKIFNRLVVMSADVTVGSKFSAKFRCFLLVVTWFFYFFKILEILPKPYTGRHVRV